MNDLASIQDAIPRSRAEDEIDVREIWGVVWSSRLMISAMAAIGAVVCIGLWWILPLRYQSSIVLLPVSSTSSNLGMGALGALSSQLGGLASVAGLSMPKDERATEAVAVLQSEKLTENYIDTNKLLPLLFPSSWDAGRGAWKPMSPEKVPTLWKANRYFKGRVRSVGIDRQTGLVTMTITWTDARLAAQWANGLVAMTNDYLRNEAIDESDRNIAYLKQQAAETDLLGLKQDIYTMIQTQISKAMLARGDKEYALKVIDPAFVPGRASSLGRLAWLVIGLLGGTSLGIATAITRRAMAPSHAPAGGVSAVPLL